jgi:hypothetical protein
MLKRAYISLASHAVNDTLEACVLSSAAETAMKPNVIARGWNIGDEQRDRVDVG